MAAGYPMEQKGVNLSASGISSQKSTLSAVGATPAFTPVPGRAFNLAHRRSADFAGSYTLERKFVGDASWYVMLDYSQLSALPETFKLTETEVGVTYRWNVTARTAGDLIARFSA